MGENSCTFRAEHPQTQRHELDASRLAAISRAPSCPTRIRRHTLTNERASRHSICPRGLVLDTARPATPLIDCPRRLPPSIAPGAGSVSSGSHRCTHFSVQTKWRCDSPQRHTVYALVPPSRSATIEPEVTVEGLPARAPPDPSRKRAGDHRHDYQGELRLGQRCSAPTARASRRNWYVHGLLGVDVGRTLTRRSPIGPSSPIARWRPARVDSRDRPRSPVAAICRPRWPSQSHKLYA